MKSTRAAANSTSSTKKKKSAAARFHAAEADEDDDDVKFVAVCGVCNEGPPKRKTRLNTQHDMMNWRAKVKSETPFRNYLDGESNCPECRTRTYTKDGGCKTITCKWFNLHKSGQLSISVATVDFCRQMETLPSVLAMVSGIVRLGKQN